ncbi:hypothetical protein E2C01_031933 [Portunus trituberculatus]|uniref:Uncharacterized protein n=1 Tax=Portunus trituberculatus TaxID=210409 RepID=A0A5B7EZ73_PORTR|nr:hypothetical protein [Portunus trituberculatus]
MEKVKLVIHEKNEYLEENKSVPNTLLEKYEKAQEEHRTAKESHEQEMKTASILIKHAELKILHSESVTKKDIKMKRLTALLEDFTGNIGAKC